MNLLASMRYLMALDEHRHFGRAAQACHITQPALSNALRTLEQEFGVVIVRRGRSYGGLTHEGERVLATAQRMLHEHEVLQQELHSSAEVVRGSLRMGAVPTATPVLARFAALLQRSQPGIVPTVLSMSSQELERGLDSLALDIGLGYTERADARDARLQVWPQYTEHYYLVRRKPSPDAPPIGPPMSWQQASTLALCLLTPDMHNRFVIDQAFATVAGAASLRPAIETNSVLTLVHSVLAGDVCSIMPGAMAATVRVHADLQALPLHEPEVRTEIGFMTPMGGRPSRALQAALAMLETDDWRAQLAEHSGVLHDRKAVPTADGEGGDGDLGPLDRA
ncbi:LysR family transcriptional regulator [Xylophilus sp. Kf1]|nr:LysR family transcriptional regulator [Xylophilus sp. Kf1]